MIVTKHSHFFMCAPSRYLPSGQPLPAGKFYVRFYGPEVQPWGWYQASIIISNYGQAMAAFRLWTAETEETINALE